MADAIIKRKTAAGLLETVYPVNENLARIIALARAEAAAAQADADAAAELAADKVAKTGDTMSGRLYVPAPDEKAYDLAADNLRASTNRHPIKLTATKNLYVGGANASDTANLFMGRGESPEMPFASLLVAMNFARLHYAGSSWVNIYLQADVTLNGFSFFFDNIIALRLLGASDARPTINLTDRILVQSGSLTLGNINFQGEGISSFFFVDGICHGASLGFGANVGFNGSVAGATVIAQRRGHIYCAGDASVDGAVTGRRYSCVQGSCINSGGRGPNLFPGTEAGTCDASSIYL